MTIYKDNEIRYWNHMAKNKANCINLTLGETNFYSPKKVKNELIYNINKNNTFYSLNKGLISLREKIAQKYDIYTKDNVLITSGATEALYISIKSIEDKLGEVIIFSPYYPAYINQINLANLNCKICKLNDHFLIPNSFLDLINANTKAIIINTPNNPTGKYLDENSFNLLNKALVKNKNIILIIDLVYEGLIYSKKKLVPSWFLKKYLERIILINSFSKTYAMSGYRLGYLFAPNNLIDKLTFIHTAINSCISPFVQNAAIKALDYDIKPHVTYLSNIRSYLIDELRKLKIKFIKPDGGIYFFISIKEFKKNSRQIAKELLNYNIGVIPGIVFGNDDYIRICFSKDFFLIKEFIKRLKLFVKENYI